MRRLTVTLTQRRGTPAHASPSTSLCSRAYRQGNIPSGYKHERRHFGAFADYKARIWQLKTADEVLEFFEERTSYDLYTKALLWKTFARNRSSHDRLDDPRLTKLLSDLENHVEDMESGTLTIVLEGAERVRNKDLVALLVARLEKEVCTREELSPREIASICLSLSALQSSSVNVHDFCKEQVMRNVEHADPAQCTAFLEGFRRWGIYDRVLVDMIVNRMLDEVDEFTPRDLATCIATMARLGLARGFLIRRLSSHAFDNLHIFTPKQYVMLLYGFAKLRFLSKDETYDLVTKIQENIEHLKPRQACEVVYALSLVRFQEEPDFVKDLIERGCRNRDEIALNQRIELALGICTTFRPLIKDPSEFHELVKSIWADPPPANRPMLIKAFDVGVAMESEHNALAPESWRAATSEADRIEQNKIEKSSRLHEEVLIQLQNIDDLKGLKLNVPIESETSNSKWTLRTDFCDENRKVAINIDTLNRPTNRGIREKFLEKMGYKTSMLNYWSWRKCRSTEAQLDYLKKELTRVHVI